MLRSADGYPFSTTFRPVTGRVGYTWEALPGLTFYSQYATAADPTVANIFNLRPTQPLLLTTSRTYETGVKHLFWDKRAEWTFSAFDIERGKRLHPRRAVNSSTSPERSRPKGIEVAGAVNPIGGLKLWGNLAFVQSRFVNFDFIDGNGDAAVLFRQHARQHVPRFVGNAGASYRFATAMAGRIRRVGPARRATVSISRTTW